MADTLAWSKSGDDGYAKLDMYVWIGGIDKIEARRQRPNENQAGAFVVYHNAIRISDKCHDRRPDAQAEALRYIYSNPKFGGTPEAIAALAQVELGRQDYNSGKGIYQNPFGIADPTARNNWVEGWLQAFGGSLVAKAINAAAATAQSNAHLSADIERLTATNEMLAHMITYAVKLGPGNSHEFIASMTNFKNSTEFYERWPDFQKWVVDLPAEPS